MPNVHYDQKDGVGSVPFNQDVNYRGFKCWLYPDMFLRLAKRIYIDPQDTSYLFLKTAIRKGKPIGSPFLEVSWDETKQVWNVWDHEGRHRVQAIKDLWPNESIEVHIFPGSGLRARDITPQMLQSFMGGVIAQDKTYVENPTAKIEHLGKPFTPQSPQQPQPMMEELKKNDFSISKMEEQYAIEYIRKKLIPIIVGYYCDVYQNTDQREAMTFLVNKTLKKIDQFGKNGKIECIVYQIKTNEDDIHELRISKNFNGELLVWNKRWGTSYKVN